MNIIILEIFLGNKRENIYILSNDNLPLSRWDLTTGQSVGARTPTLGTRCRFSHLALSIANGINMVVMYRE